MRKNKKFIIYRSKSEINKSRELLRFRETVRLYLCFFCCRRNASEKFAPFVSFTLQVAADRRGKAKWGNGERENEAKRGARTNYCLGGRHSGRGIGGLHQSMLPHKCSMLINLTSELTLGARLQIGWFKTAATGKRQCPNSRS